MMQTKREELVSQAQPPQAVLDAVRADPEAVKLKLGAGLNRAYAATLRLGKLALSNAEGGQYANVLL
ncbi:MAG: hypothetical protein KJ069_30400 [Anaerolineae bacterium]|nr:hypothetical protein [Anaerolineae bacterium]